MKKLTKLQSAKLFALVLLFSGASAQTFPQTIRHETGQTTLQTAPKRVVVLEYALADDVVALGRKPVAWAREKDVPDYLGMQLADVPSIGTRAQPNLEKLLALKPDLIIADSTRHKEIYPQLSKIAPTIVLNVFRSDYQGQLDSFVTLGKTLGKEAEARQLVAAQEVLVKKAQLSANRKAGGVLVAALPPSGLFVLHSRESVVGGLVEAMGRTNLASSVGRDNSLYSIALDELVRLDPAGIALLINPGEKTVLTEWQKNPLWQNLAAVKNNRVYTFDRDLWSKARGIQALGMITKDAVRSGFLQNSTPKK